MFSHRKKLLVIVLISLLVVAVIMVGVFAFKWWQVKGELVRQTGQNENLTKQVDELQKEIQELKTAQAIIEDETIEDKKSEVTITTDKVEYEQGEAIKITVRNNLDRSIWYVDFTQQDLRFWDIEKFEDNRWRKLEYTKGESFRLPIEEGGKEVCYIVLYEMEVGQVAELKPSSELSYKWNQKICLLDSKKQPLEPVLLPKGRYRFTFEYALSTIEGRIAPKANLVNPQTVSSNESIIK